ncbi:division/cell wall cluster transcriptional repressor MraZ [Nocardioides sp.]|uniref:division/cell wall cluster transcriptional repressor MraZ n=1 Tax=Nocardioides sp. TaxID=35761 RepID=UPI00271C8EB8|nr:division/cell wall cluster transcriptional repressor MraZ [Nocardioides sp.]MDO9455854.1 division/cell wall cluster transcriptional repressor MraZ [Nocardioides sp.]
MRFMGTFRPKLDEKGRLFLPAKFRDRLAEGVVVTQGQEKCLVVWPPEVFDVEADKAAERSMTDKAARGYQRMFFSGGDEVVPDKQGRVSIAAGLRDYAGLDRDVVVIGVRNRLEIWNPQSWDDYQAAEIQRFADLDESD